MKRSGTVCKLERGHSFVTDRQTDAWGKTICFPTLKRVGGIINYSE